jgi:hypothetical protein
MEDQRVKVCKIAEMTAISKIIVHENAALLQHHCHFQDNGESFMESIVIGEETWVCEEYRLLGCDTVWLL